MPYSVYLSPAAAQIARQVLQMRWIQRDGSCPRLRQLLRSEGFHLAEDSAVCSGICISAPSSMKLISGVLAKQKRDKKRKSDKKQRSKKSKSKKQFFEKPRIFEFIFLNK